MQKTTKTAVKATVVLVLGVAGLAPVGGQEPPPAAPCEGSVISSEAGPTHCCINDNSGCTFQSFRHNDWEGRKYNYDTGCYDYNFHYLELSSCSWC
jgi:hypothetical protein